MGWDGTPKSAKTAGEKDDGSSDPISFEHFTDEDVERWIEEQQKATIESAICCGVQGLDGTAKSGIVLDCRSQEEIDDGVPPRQIAFVSLTRKGAQEARDRVVEQLDLFPEDLPLELRERLEEFRISLQPLLPVACSLFGESQGLTVIQLFATRKN